MDLLSLPEYVIKKGILHGHWYGKKSQETENYLANHIEEEMQKKKVPRNPWPIFMRTYLPWANDLNIIEMKKIVDDGMLLQTKVILTTFQNRNTSSTRTSGCLIPIRRVLTPFHWEIVLISSERSLLRNVYTKTLEKTTCGYLLLQAQTMAVGTEFVFYMVELTRFLVIFLKFRNSRRGGKQSLENERSNPLLIVLWSKPPNMTFKNSIYFVTDRSFTADGGLL